MIVDYFMYYNEPELLELRYHMLKDIVDKFVISEANHTFSGIEKQYTVKKVIEELQLNLDKFIVLEVDNQQKYLVPNDFDRWNSNALSVSDKIHTYTRQRFQRDAILTVLDRFTDDDIFIIGDIDEIPKPEALKYIASVSKNHPENILKVPLVLLEGSADKRVYKEDNKPVEWATSLFLCNKNLLKKHGPTQLRAEHETGVTTIRITENGKFVEDLGWHFTWMGSKEFKLNKAKSCAHSVALKFVDNVSVATKELLKDELGEDFGLVVKYHHKPYPLSDLPKEIFALPRVKNFLLQNQKPIKVVDYTMYFNEAELLELRYHMLKEHVDLFVISESNTTFSGKSKEFSVEKIITNLGLDPNKFRILNTDMSALTNQYINEIDKIGSIVANDTQNILAWTRERLQRDALTSILDEFDDDCVFIVNDVDEIIKPSALPYLARVCKENQHSIIKIPLVMLESRADKRLVNKNHQPVPWDQSMFLATKSQLKIHGPNIIRAGLQRTWPVRYIIENNNRLEDLGWHFTWMGDLNRQKIKATNYGHAGNLNVVNTLSQKTSELLGNSLNNKIQLATDYSLADYDINNLPTEIFDYKRIRDFLLPKKSEIKIGIENFDQQLLIDFIKDPQNYITNFKLGYSYELAGQTAPAVSYYLRTAEKTDKLDVQYESLLRLANCFKRQKNRNFTVTGIYNRAITVQPTRPEAYFLMANFQLEIKEYQNAYLYSTIGLSLINNSHDKLMTDLTYEGQFELEYIQAKSGWYVGFYNKAKEMLYDLRNRNDVSQYYKSLIEEDIRTVIKN